jgi:ParB-like chromosome segregation protein Spo0J
MNYHPLAELFPLLAEEDLDALAKDIKEHGQHEPIVTNGGEILDGRNRYLACQRVGVEPKCVEYRGSDPLEFVLGKNLYRRHLSAEQRAMVAAKLSEAGAVGRPKKIFNSLKISGEQASKALNVNRDYVSKAAKVLKAEPRLAEEVLQGVTSLKAAYAEVIREEMGESPAQRLAAKVRDIDDKAARVFTAMVENIIAKGRAFIAAKADLPHEEWLTLLKELGVKPPRAKCFMAIASHPVLSNEEYFPNLPPCWETLYRLTRFSGERLEDFIEAELVHPWLDLAEVCQWAA